MADLILREAALDVLVTSPNFHTTLTRIEELPAVDAAPVVRCWECKYRHDPLRCQMDSEGMSTPDDWFCADGKRRDDDAFD